MKIHFWNVFYNFLFKKYYHKEYPKQEKTGTVYFCSEICIEQYMKQEKQENK